uniref:Uncharacterized protein n=1 Tax=Vitis vinifera TaxID=29760 RepID=F6HN62_VITVI
MAAPFFSTPFQPYVYRSPQENVTPFQILGGAAQMVQIMLKPQEKIIAKLGSICYMSGSTQMENVYIPENQGSKSRSRPVRLGRVISASTMAGTGPIPELE